MCVRVCAALMGAAGRGVWLCFSGFAHFYYLAAGRKRRQREFVVRKGKIQPAIINCGSHSARILGAGHNQASCVLAAARVRCCFVVVRRRRRRCHRPAIGLENCE